MNGKFVALNFYPSSILLLVLTPRDFTRPLIPDILRAQLLTWKELLNFFPSSVFILKQDSAEGHP